MLGRVGALVNERTQVVPGHSLGSLVAREVCHRLTAPLPLLVTLGSPLESGTVVLPRLRRQPPAWTPQALASG